MDSRLKKLKWNSTLALTYQVILIVCGFVLPKCYLWFFGSEVNGLLSSITQFLSFINICDMGISTVVASAYYQPLAEGNMAGVSRIFVYAKRFFRLIGYILLGYVAVLLVVYPRIVANRFDLFFTGGLILVMCISQFAQYFIGNAYQILLNADQKSYIQLLINGSTLIVSTLVSVLLMYLGFAIQLVKLSASIIYLLRPIAMMCYVRKHYSIDYHACPCPDTIPQKKNGVIQHIAYMVYENTDVLVLTVCASLSDVSVYSVYTLVTGSIRNVINAAMTGFQALFGNMLARKETESLKRVFSLFDWALHTVCVLLFTVTVLLIVPFVKIYTEGIADAQYDVPRFAVCITLAYGVNCIRNGMFNLIRAAGHYRQTQTASLAEAALNLVLSIIMVFRYGLLGVAIGTLVSASFFVAYEMYYLSRNIICRPVRQFIEQLGIDVVAVAVMLAAGSWIESSDRSLLMWLLSAVEVFSLCAVGTLVVQLVFRREKILEMMMFLRQKGTDDRQ